MAEVNKAPNKESASVGKESPKTVLDMLNDMLKTHGTGVSRIKQGGDVLEQPFDVFVDETNNKVIVVMDLEGDESKSGKTYLVGSTHGYITTDCEYPEKGSMLQVNANVSYENPDYVEPEISEEELLAMAKLQVARKIRMSKSRKLTQR